MSKNHCTISCTHGKGFNCCICWAQKPKSAATNTVMRQNVQHTEYFTRITKLEDTLLRVKAMAENG